jgi:ATP-binding protein involved in chromosome partitioning
MRSEENGISMSKSMNSNNAGRGNEDDKEEKRFRQRLAGIRHKILVLSGKGGVGKSMVAVNLAAALHLAGKRVGLLDIDIHGPSIPTMLGLEKRKVLCSNEGGEIIPLDVAGLKVMSIGFFLPEPDDAVIWRGPMKAGVIRQFLGQVAWGELDYLVIDSPPGTGDEPLSVCQLLDRIDGSVIVTTPQKVAAVDARKSVSFCRQLNVPVLGIVENMSGFTCPRCGEITPILRKGAGRLISEDMKIPFLGSLPIDPKIAESCDAGRVFLQDYSESPTADLLRAIIKPVLSLDKKEPATEGKNDVKNKEDITMRIAVPMVDGKLSRHFGHCDQFALLDVDTAAKKILGREDIEAPPHQPGLLPSWLAERGAKIIIAGGMGNRALELFREQGIQVCVGASPDTPETLVKNYLEGTLQLGQNVCDH